MESLFKGVLTAGCHGSIVILAVLVLRLLLRKAPRKYICFLWLLVGMRLLAPIEIQSSLSLQPASDWNRPIASFSEAAPPENQPLAAYPKKETVPSEQTDRSADTEAAAFPVMPVPTEKPEPPLAKAVPYLWLDVTLCFALYAISSYLRLKKRVRGSVRIPGGWACDRIETAFILGYIRPKIYIPMGLCEEDRSCILAHERTHLEKGDHWFKLIGFLALALHWFNPLVWVAYALLCKDIELACDERVVQFMELEERKRYASALLRCTAQRSHFAACPVAFGEISVKDRIQQVLSYRRPGFWISFLAVLAVLFVAVCLLTNPKDEVMPEAEPAETVAPLQERPKTEEEMLRQVQIGLEETLNTQDGGMHFWGTKEKESSIFWQCSYVVHGDDRLWNIIDSRDGYSETEQLILGGGFYREKNDLWVISNPVQDPLEECRQWFRWDDLEELEGFSESITTSAKGYSYSEIKFGGALDKHWVSFSFTFDQNGTLVSGSVTGRKTDYGDTLTFTREDLAESALQLKYEQAAQRVVSLDEYEEKKIPSNYTEYDQSFRLGSVQMRWWYFDKSWQFALGAENAESTGLTLFYCETDEGYRRLTADEGFWLEKLVNGKWTRISPKAEVTNAPETEIHPSFQVRDTLKVDWTDSYGALNPGFYRLGRYHTVTMPDGRKETQHCYAKFRLYGPNQAPLLNQCRQALDDLRKSDTYHICVTDWGTSFAQPQPHYTQEEVWKQDGDCLDLITYVSKTADGENWDPKGSLWIGGKYYGLKWAGEPLSSSLSSVWQSVDGYMDNSNQELWTSDFEWYDSGLEDVEQDGSTIRIYETYDFDDRFAYKETSLFFQDDGSLARITAAYLPSLGCAEKEKVMDRELTVLDTSPEEIRKVIQSQDVSVPMPFSYAEDASKYLNAKTGGFRNTVPKAVSCIEDAIALADRECTLKKDQTDILTAYYQTEVYRDEEAGIWKVVLFWWQDDDIYQVVYLNDQGITQMTVYEK